MCARHFDYQFNQFLYKFLMSNALPFGQISDWFYRVEYQQHGSPHIHMLIWLKDAPVFGVNGDDTITAFIDNIISCQKPSNNIELRNLVNRQIHRHSHTCKKKPKRQCRFNFPQPPMRSTKILYPLIGNMSANEIKNHKESRKAINKHLNDLKEGKGITFDQLLNDLNITENNCLLFLLVFKCSNHVYKNESK